MAGHFNTLDLAQSYSFSYTWFSDDSVARRILVSRNYNRIQTGMKVNLATQNPWALACLDEKESGVYSINSLLNKKWWVTIAVEIWDFILTWSEISTRSVTVSIREDGQIRFQYDLTSMSVCR